MNQVPITVCLTHFKSLALANLDAALYSLSRQDLSQVAEVLVLDNDTGDDVEDLLVAIRRYPCSVPIRLLSFKHDDLTRTHAWSTNYVVKHAITPWIFFTRADYVLDFDIIARLWSIVAQHDDNWNGFVTGHVYHLHVDVGECAKVGWRESGARMLRTLPGIENDYMLIDAGVWLARRSAFHAVNGLDEGLTAWGHAQTHFQWKLHESGVEFVKLPECLFYHPLHAGERDLSVAHQQLDAIGADIKKLWERYDGPSPY